jgi:hypothetical protein
MGPKPLGHTPEAIAERIAANSMPEPNSGCLLWVGSVDGKGYGRLRVNGKQIAAHRLAWMCVHGPIPSGLFVCHKCDVRCCVNPAHYFLGTNADNQADRAAKLRALGMRWRSETNASAKLSVSKVVEIRASSDTTAALARKFGVHEKTIWSVRANRRWSA